MSWALLELQHLDRGLEVADLAVDVAADQVPHAVGEHLPGGRRGAELLPLRELAMQVLHRRAGVDAKAQPRAALQVPGQLRPQVHLLEHLVERRQHLVREVAPEIDGGLLQGDEAVLELLRLLRLLGGDLRLQLARARELVEEGQQVSA